MMPGGLLAGDELRKLANDGVLYPVPAANINPSSIDVTLGDLIMVEHDPGVRKGVVHLRDRVSPWMDTLDLSFLGGFSIPPGGFVLASTFETFNLPDYFSAEYKLKSSMARAGLNHLNAGWIHAGFNGVLTLELVNVNKHNAIHIQPGDKIGQIVFFEHDRVDLTEFEPSVYSNRRQVTPAEGDF